MTSRAIGTQLWRKLIENLEYGVVVFNDKGNVIYANDAAAYLFGYERRDLLELDRDDFGALCYPNRLDGPRFSATIEGGGLPQQELLFRVMTADRHLQLKLTTLELAHGDVLALMIQDIPYWQADLISQTVLSDQMNSPLVFAASYVETLLERLENGNAHPFELSDLARITRDSVIQAMGLWRKLDHLYYSSTGETPEWHMEAIDLDKAFSQAVIEVTEWAVQGRPDYEFSLPEDLPPVMAERTQLHNALCALLDTASAHLTPNDRVYISATHRINSLQVKVRPVGNQNILRSDLFDVVPGAIAEQVIARLNGRIWLESDENRDKIFVLILPAWADRSKKHTESAGMSPQQHRQALLDLAEVLSRKQPED